MEKLKLKEINGFLIPQNVIMGLAAWLLGQSPGLVYGDPGLGKTFTLKTILPLLYYELFGRECILIKAELYVLKHLRDGFVDLDFKNNNLIKKFSEFVQAIHLAKSQNRDFIILVDELDKIMLRDQSQLLSLMEIRGSNYIALPELEIEEIHIPENCKVIAIANYLNNGAFEISDPLKDRLKIIKWPVPSPEVAASVLSAKYDSFQPKTYQFFEDLEIRQRKVNQKIIRTIVDIAYQLHRDEDQPYSFRHLIKLIDTYINQDCDGLLAELGLAEENEYKDSYYRYEYKLKSQIYAKYEESF